jgi:hypothetical protein
LFFKRNIALLIGISSTEQATFLLKRESRIDRYFKRIKFSVEFQTGYKYFDDRIYIATDNENIHKQLASNPVLIDLIHSLFDLNFKNDCSVEGLYNENGKLWVKYNLKRGFNNNQTDKITSKTVTILQGIEHALAHNLSEAEAHHKDHFLKKRKTLESATTGIIICGAFFLTISNLRSLWFSKIPTIINKMELLQDAIIVGLVMTVCLVTWTIYWLGKSSRAHLTLLFVVLGGSFGSICTAYYQLSEINMFFDRTATEELHLTVKRKREKRGKRGHISRFLLILDNPDRKLDTNEIIVTRSLYDSVQYKDVVTINQKKGFLNYPWIESINKKTGSKTVEDSTKSDTL